MERGQVGGVPGGFQPGGAGELPRSRVGEGDVPLRLGGVLLLGLLLRREPRGGEGHQPLDGRDAEAVDAGGELLVDPPRCLEGQRAGGRATRRVL